MSPPAATLPPSPVMQRHDKVAEKKLAVGINANAAPGVEMENMTKMDWEAFKFAPIRESTVSRAMSMRFPLSPL